MLPAHYAGGLSSLGPLILSALLAVPAAAQGSDWVPFDRSQFSGNATLDTEGHVQLFWEIGDEYSTYGIASQSSGYLALGFSETGAMTGADMAVGYMDDGEFVLENRWASGFVTPQLSEDQEYNVRLQGGGQEDGVTWFIFEKKNTADCLENQVTVATRAWQWFIYAFSDDNTFGQHEDENKGKRYIKLGSEETIFVNEIVEVQNTMNWTIVQPEITIPTDETTYCYTLHRVPEGDRHFMIAERPRISSDLLHHLVIYACYSPSDDLLEMLGQEPNCDYENFSNPCNGFVTEWAPGMSGRTFEDGYGKPFGSDFYEYVMFETHYSNPAGLEGLNDTASYTLLYTDEEVDNVIGSLTLGDLQVNGWFLEPGQELVAHSTVCTPECTGDWPEEGITAFSVFHHMHARGRHARVQIIRDGEEIAPLSTLRDFEYDFQFSKGLEQIQLFPGDRFITTCWYDTSDDTEPVPGGVASKDEMCFAWVDYYPLSTILACTQYDTGNETLGLCLDTSEAEPTLYETDMLTASYENFTHPGDVCLAPNGTTQNGSAQSGNDGGDDDDSAASTISFGSAVLITLLSLFVI
ncbi:PHM/PNGase F domain-containing protein [Stachybotrys elegans]|uniref:PHM/PNGase F domain-containing protein n=1 Tax=Stachybotrys elegans TaxID=80388 RepID=A0A8K0SV62_9HYPO|nr:PHM/PNGase F domain-containing protein [Stachybotrys elegans]